MTNFGTLAILAALPHDTPPRQLRLLIAVETHTPESDGWRKIGADLLMKEARISYPTYKKARSEVISAGWAEYKPGGGPGVLARWRLLIDLGRARWEDRVTTIPEPANVGNPGFPPNGGNPDPGNAGNPHTGMPVTPDALTSGNAGHSLGSSALGSSALSRGPAADLIRAAVPGIADDEIETFIAKKIKPNCRIGNIERYLGAWSQADISAAVAAFRSEGKAAKSKAAKDAVAKFRDRAKTKPPCEHGQPGGNLVDPSGTILCPSCRQGLAADPMPP